MITKELIEYIKNCREQKIPEEQIISALKEQGWVDEDINAGLAQAPQYTEPIQNIESLEPTEEQKPKKKFLIPIIIIGIIILGGAAWAGYNYWLKPGTSEKQPLQEQPISQEQQKEQVSDETAGWKTYRNETYGFEFKYPEDWDYTILESPTSPTMLAPKDIIGAVKESFQNIKNDKSLTLWATLYDKNLFEKGILPNRGKSTEYIKRTSSTIEVGGIKGNEYISEYIKDKGDYNVGNKTVTVDLAINNSYLTFDLFDYQYIDIFRQIVSSFKVVK